jgi:hypothetical protein
LSGAAWVVDVETQNPLRLTFAFISAFRRLPLLRMPRFFAVLLTGLIFATNSGAQEAASEDSGSSSITPTESAPTGSAPAESVPPPSPTSGTAATPSETSPLGAGVISGGTPAAQQAPPTFSLPGGAGFLPRTLTAGEGRFAQPPYRLTLSVSQGYDDNIFNSPAHPSKQETQKVAVLTPESKQVATGRFVFVSGFLVPELRLVTKNVATFVEVPAPPPPPPKQGSLVTNGRLAFQTQSASPRTVYTFDASAGGLYYWSRPGDSTDYNGNLALTFLHRISARTTVTAQADAVYASQPNFSRINTPTNQTSDGYVSATAKIDLNHSWSPRLGSVTSYIFNGTFLQSDAAGGDVFDNQIANQVRYTLSPRSTLIIDLRESANTHPNDPAQDSTNTFLLVGVDYMASTRLRATALVGEQVRAQTQNGTALATPYLETTTAYQFTRGSSFAWTNRFGFEDAGNAAQSRLTYRTNLSLNYVIGARTTASAGVAYNRNSTTLIASNEQKAAIENNIQANIGLQYVLNRSLSFNANYSLTQTLTEQAGTSYRRNQIFLGGTYSF